VLLHTVRVLLMDMLAADMASTLLRFCSSALSAARRKERAAARVKAQRAAAAAAVAAAAETKGSASASSTAATAAATAAATDDIIDDVDTDTDAAVAAELTGLAAEEARERTRAAAAFFGLDKLNARALAHLFTAAGRGLSGAEAAALAWHGLNAGLSFDDLPEPPAWSGQLLQLACSKGQKREPRRRNGGAQAASS
jgi:hypothetical protein